MEWIELIVHTTTQGADLVSDRLMQLGAAGTMVEDRADVPDPSKPNGYWELIDPKLIESMPEDVLVHAWLEPDATFAERAALLRESLTALKASSQAELGSLKIDSAQVRDEDWAEVWKQFYKPFRAGQCLVVKPTWEQYEAGKDDLVIEIDPGMAFGSGMHETTSMCLELLEEAGCEGKRVIDVGTGSGILAIGAALLGAEKVLATDIDPTAVKVAAENVVHNHLEERIDVRQGDLLEATDAVCDLCVANIIADVICAFAAPLKEHIVPSGRFICSGIIREREDEVLSALTAAGYEIEQIRHKGEWTAILSGRR